MKEVVKWIKRHQVLPYRIILKTFNVETLKFSEAICEQKNFVWYFWLLARIAILSHVKALMLTNLLNILNKWM